MLEERGLPESGFVNARSALEHGVYLSLLAAHESGDPVLDALEHQYLRSLQLIVANTTEIPGLAADMIDELIAGVNGAQDKGVTVFQQACERLVAGDQIYRHYRTLSNYSHAGFGSANPFMIASFAIGDPSKSLTLTSSPMCPEVRTGLWLAVGACAWAGWSVDKLFATDYFGSVLDTAVRDIGFIPLLPK